MERLRRALGPTFRLDGKVAQGGMGTVYRAFDLSLHRSVAVKTLPLQATAELVERFHREAQTLAQLNHPCIVPVYQVSSQAQDIHYYVMQWMEGETVQTRLERGPLSPREAVDLGIDLLSALAVSHKHKVIHRDVKPANVFLVDHRTVLVDFGIAKSLTGELTVLTVPEQMPPHTPAYMAPEQGEEGGQVTERTDLFAVGLLLYETMNGERLSRAAIESPDWSKIPRRLAQVLRRALAEEPSERWPDAQSFIKALRAASRPRLMKLIAIGAATAIVAALAYWFLHPLPDPGTIVITRFERGPGIDSTLTNVLAELLYGQLRGTGRLHVVGPDSRLRDQAKTRVYGRVESIGDSLEVQVSIQQGLEDQVLTRISGSKDSLGPISSRIANRLMVKLVPIFGDRDVAQLSESPEANLEWAAGETDFRQVHWADAQSHFNNAVRLDSTFALAIWRLANVLRWRRLAVNIDLKPLLTRYGQQLGELDRLLFEAQIEPNVTRRFQLYQVAVTRYPKDGMASLFYADELMHRGPLAGHDLTEALAIFSAALANDSSLAAAWFHIGWIYIRLGDPAGAKYALENQLRWLPVGTAGTDIDISFFLQLSFAERFAPDKVPNEKPSADIFQQIVKVFRWAISFDIPSAQLKYARLVDSLAPYAYVRASAASGEGIALVALGRPLEALASFDRAQVLRATAEADLHRAQWRVIPPAMGWYQLPKSEIEQGRRLLVTMLANDSLAARAAWTLALDAAASNDSLGYAGYYSVLSARGRDPVAGRLRTLLDANTLARGGNYAKALNYSSPLLAFDSAGRVGDPFARAVLRLGRGEWLKHSNQLMEADRELSWYENTDLAGEPTDEVQPIEVDWAAGTIARLRRGWVSLESGHFKQGCDHLRRVTQLWNQAEPALRVLADSASAQLGRSPCTT